jgi:hypothetical protein
MSNWDAAVESARKDGEVPSFFPVDFPLPMVAPRDLGRIAARLMTEGRDHTGWTTSSGPSSSAK